MKRKVIVACGGAVATSTMAAEEIKENSKEPIAEEKEKEKYSEKSSSPKTGDKSDLLLWIPLLSASFFGVLEMAICCRKKELINL